MKRSLLSTCLHCADRSLDESIVRVWEEAEDLILTLRVPCLTGVNSFAPGSLSVGRRCQTIGLLYTQQVHGTASPRQLTVDVSTYCWNVQNVSVTVCQTCQLFEELCDTADDQMFNKTCFQRQSCSARRSATTVHSVAALRSQASFTHALTSRT